MKPLCLGVLSLTFASALTAQTFPERPVQIITPYAAGGGLDILTRTLAQRLSTLWGKQVLVDNKPGAGSTLGTALAAKAPKDGHTLLVASTPLGVAPAVYLSLSYDARRDFAPLALVATTPEVLVVTASLAWPSWWRRPGPASRTSAQPARARSAISPRIRSIANWDSARCTFRTRA